MHEPTGDLSVIDCIYQVHRANDVTSCKHMRFRSILHSIPVNADFLLLIFNQSFNVGLFVLGSESTDNGITLEFDLFSSEAVFSLLVGKILIELHCHGHSIIFNNLGRSQV